MIILSNPLIWEDHGGHMICACHTLKGVCLSGTAFLFPSNYIQNNSANFSILTPHNAFLSKVKQGAACVFFFFYLHLLQLLPLYNITNRR